MKYVSKRVDFSPVLHDKKEAVARCIRDMTGKGFKLTAETAVGISWAVLVFEAV